MIEYLIGAVVGVLAFVLFVLIWTAFSIRFEERARLRTVLKRDPAGRWYIAEMPHAPSRFSISFIEE
jgi:hypothetical protein